MITEITKRENGYEIVLDGQFVFVPEAPGNRHYQMVLDAIEAGQPVLDPPALLWSAQDVRFEAGRRIHALGSEYTSEERETWPVQVSEAKAIMADATAPAPLLSAIATARGVPIEAMAQVVLTKAQQLAAATGAILAAQAVLLAQEPIPDDYADDKHWPALP